MEYKRILTVQDISCVGQCSMTVALPVLSACGHETCVLPTAVLSTHTGGFGKPAVAFLDDKVDAFVQHWKDNNISFDCILTGYLGSVAAIDTVERLSGQLLAEGGILIVDPAMADHGKRYSGLSEEYGMRMSALCRKADIMIPNITEAAMFSGVPYVREPDPEYITALLKALDHPCVVLTGVGYEKDTTGAVLYEQGNMRYFSHRRVDRNFHGTGDLFAACFTGALMQHSDKEKAMQIASEYVLRCIELTQQNPAHWYGIKFEAALPDLMRMLR